MGLSDRNSWKEGEGGGLNGLKWVKVVEIVGRKGRWRNKLFGRGMKGLERVGTKGIKRFERGRKG